jgi:hypothetical protein
LWAQGAQVSLLNHAPRAYTAQQRQQHQSILYELINGTVLPSIVQVFCCMFSVAWDHESFCYHGSQCKELPV